jgi:hypothetical protein
MPDHPMKAFAAVALIAVLPAALRAQPATAVLEDVERAALGIRAESLSWRVGVMAHDSMLGRDTPSPGLEATAAWIASELQRLGLQPGGDAGTFIQRYPVRTRVATPEGVRVVDGSAPNVVGILQGSDPLLRDEFVVYSAHMDHVGVGAPDARGDSIYNGADDNASGTAAVMEVAQAMASLERRPARSVIFVLVSGEEKGLWGSAYFVDNPPVPVERMVANFNVDMVGRNWPDTIVAIGREHSDLGETLARVNDARPELGMAAIDDLWPQERFYFRSDHYNFARKGVPALFFFNGVHEDYHRPSDEPDRIDADKAARVARLLFFLGIEVADAPSRPRWEPASYQRIVAPR